MIESVIENLSYDVINEVCSYLLAVDIIYLCSINKYLIKYKHCCYYYNFNQEYSLLYYNDDVYRNEVQSIIDVKKNLSINLGYNDDVSSIDVLKDINTIDISMTKVIDLSPLVNTSKVDLSCTDFDTKTMMSLSNILWIDLSNCFQVTDISMLAQARYIDVSFTNVSDVSMLGLQSTLILAGCINIKDISNLGNVSHLDLTGCINIVDVSNLGNVHTLALKNCDKIKDVSMLGNVYQLDLGGCELIEDVSMLKNVHSLDISMCDRIKDVSMLTGVSKLNLSFMKHIKEEEIKPMLSPYVPILFFYGDENFKRYYCL